MSQSRFETLFFDTGGVLALARRKRQVQAYLERARAYRADAYVSWLTRAELQPGSDELAVAFALQQLRRSGVTEGDCVAAAKLMAATGAGGRTVDALIATAIIALPRPVVVLTSDPKDMTVLLAGQKDVAIVAV